jgi:cytochrome c553
MRQTLILAASVISLAGAGCTSREIHVTFSEGKVLGGKKVSAETLNLGREAYMHFCYACHGEKGDGNGPAAPGLRPPPRDFRTALFKFGKVYPQASLPHDDDLKKIVRDGLAGTAMLPWDVPDELLDPIIQYIKTLSPMWQDPDEEVGERIVLDEDPDPWTGNKKEAIARGKEVYHGAATCQQCHAAYATRAEIYAAAKAANKPFELRDNLYQPELRPSEVELNGYKLKILPPDFLFNEIRSGISVEELYRTIAAGVKPTMPPWHQALPADDLWAMAYYVRSLVELKNTPKAATLRDELSRQPEFVPPEPAVEPEPPAGADEGGAAAPAEPPGANGGAAAPAPQPDAEPPPAGDAPTP